MQDLLNSFSKSLDLSFQGGGGGGLETRDLYDGHVDCGVYLININIIIG